MHNGRIIQINSREENEFVFREIVKPLYGMVEIKYAWIGTSTLGDMIRVTYSNWNDVPPYDSDEYAACMGPIDGGKWRACMPKDVEWLAHAIEDTFVICEVDDLVDARIHHDNMQHASSTYHGSQGAETVIFNDTFIKQNLTFDNVTDLKEADVKQDTSSVEDNELLDLQLIRVEQTSTSTSETYDGFTTDGAVSGSGQYDNEITVGGPSGDAIYGPGDVRFEATE